MSAHHARIYRESLGRWTAGRRVQLMLQGDYRRFHRAARGWPKLTLYISDNERLLLRVRPFFALITLERRGCHMRFATIAVFLLAVYPNFTQATPRKVNGPIVPRAQTVDRTGPCAGGCRQTMASGLLRAPEERFERVPVRPSRTDLFGK